MITMIMRSTKKIRSVLLRASCFCALIVSPAMGLSDTPQQPSAAPVLPAVGGYHYFARYFIQWFSGNGPYSSVEAYIDQVAADSPRCIVLTEKKTNKAIWYCNSQAAVDRLKLNGREATLTPIDLKVPQEVAKGSTFSFAFREKGGEPVQWRFVAADSVNERGAGLTPMPESTALELRYRERGTVAGAGSVIQIGKIADEPEIWKEISSPPYFVAYRGSYTEGLDLLELDLGRRNWKLETTPTDIKQGAKWLLRSSDGQERSLTLEGLTDRGATIKQQDGIEGELVYVLPDIKGGVSSYPNEIRFVDGAHSCQISINASGAFNIDMGKARGIARGNLVASPNGSGTTWKWQFKVPDWARQRALESKLEINGTTYVISLQTSK